MESRRKIRFADFEIDMLTAEVRQNGHKFVLQGQPFQVLAILLERPGELVTREELKKRLWLADTFVDFDHSLNKAVNRLRETLSDSADTPRYIETLPRRGYRFIAPVVKDEPKLDPRPSTLQSLNTPDEISPDAVGPTTGSTAHPTTTRRPEWTRKIVAIFIVSLLFLASLNLLFRQRAVHNQHVGADNLEIIKLTDNGRTQNVAISPDGRYVAYTVVVREKQELRLRQVATRADVQILPPDSGNFVGLTFSPDGNYLYVVRSDRNDLSFRYLYRIPALGGTPQKIITDVDSGISFSPDGHHIAYEHWVPPRNEAELKIANADGTGERVLGVVHNASFMSLGGPGPSWSPDGSTIVFSKLVAGKQQRWVLYAVTASDGAVRELYSSSEDIGRPVWLHDGKAMVLSRYEPNLNRTQLWTVSFPQGIARRFTHDISNYSEDLSITKDGSMIASTVSTAESHIWVSAFPATPKGRQITSGEPAFFGVRETIDRRILSSGGDGRLWVMNWDGNERAVFGSVSEVGWFNTCGRFVVLTSDESGSTVLKRLNLDGTSPMNLVNGNLWSPTCSQHDNAVYYVNSDQPQKIWRISINGGAAVEIASILGDCIMSSLTVSPDGESLAYTYSAYSRLSSPGEHVAVVRASDGKTLKIFDVPGDAWSPGPYWTSDGRALQTLRTQDGVSNIWELPLEGSEARQLTHFTSGQIFDFTWSSRPTRLYLSRGKITSDVILLTGLH